MESSEATDHASRSGAQVAVATQRQVAVAEHREQRRQQSDKADAVCSDKAPLLHERLHVPVRSGRYLEQMANQGRGAASRVNCGIGRGFARGTELAQIDSRANTWVCGTAGCDALVDVHWARRRAKAARPKRAVFVPADGCAHCTSAFKRAQYIKGQRDMARQLSAGDRRLVRRHAVRTERELWEQPTAAVEAAVAAALAQVERVAAARYKRGRRS